MFLVYWSEWERCKHSQRYDCRVCINSLQNNRKCGDHIRRRSEDSYNINDKYTLRDLDGEYPHNHMDTAHVTPVVLGYKNFLIVSNRL